MIMVRVETVVSLVLVGILVYSTDFTNCESSPDLGPAGPTFETCENYECPANSICNDDNGFINCMCIIGKVGENCDIDDPCLERKNKCPAGSICYGECEPNVICEAATGIAHCRGCVDGWTGFHCEIEIKTCQGSECDIEDIIDEKEDNEGVTKDGPVTDASRSGKRSERVCSVAVLIISIILCTLV